MDKFEEGKVILLAVEGIASAGAGAHYGVPRRAQYGEGPVNLALFGGAEVGKLMD